MRIRSTKPEFWRSRLIASVSWDARFVLKALESYVDDNGVGEDDVNTLVGDCFLHDLIREPSRTLARVSEAISELHQAGLVWRYEANGRNLLYVSFWESVQRIDKPLKGRNPRPDGTMNYKDSEIRETVATPREDSRSVAPGTEEQGNRGTGDKPFAHPADAPRKSKPDHSQQFDEFWAAYPVKKGKEPARKAFEKAIKVAPFEAIMSGLEAYKRELGQIMGGKTLDGKTPKWAQGWLNDRRWEDEPEGPSLDDAWAAAMSGPTDPCERLGHLWITNGTCGRCGKERG